MMIFVDKGFTIMASTGLSGLTSCFGNKSRYIDEILNSHAWSRRSQSGEAPLYVNLTCVEVTLGSKKNRQRDDPA